MTSRVCRCGKGYVSAYDGKCGHCRTRRERAEHKRLISTPPSAPPAPPLMCPNKD